MKELKVKDENGNIILVSLINVDGDDWMFTPTLSIRVDLAMISLIDDEETQQRKREKRESLCWQ